MNDHTDHYEPQEDGSTGIGVLILGASVIWAWGFAAGLFIHWVFFTK